MNSESEYSQLHIDTTHIRWHKRMFIFFQNFLEVRLDSGTAYPRCNENGHCQIHWKTGKGQQVGMNSESEYSQLHIDTTHIRWHKRMFIFFQKIRKNGVKIRIFYTKKCIAEIVN